MHKKKLTRAQRETLEFVKKKSGRVSYFDIARAGIGTVPVHALCARGALHKVTDSDGEISWTLTDMGRDALESGMI